jgi:hypothetical protein
MCWLEPGWLKCAQAQSTCGMAKALFQPVLWRPPIRLTKMHEMRLNGSRAMRPSMVMYDVRGWIRLWSQRILSWIFIPLVIPVLTNQQMP